MHCEIPSIPCVLLGLTLTTYLATLKNRNRSPDLDIYTPATRQMLKDWVITAPQMDNLVHTYSLCNAERAIRFGRDNAWHFERSAPRPYQYAFVDREFDSRGFPREK